MSEEKLYAVKNDEGKYWDFLDSYGFCALDVSDCPTTPSKDQAELVADEHGGNVVTFVEEPKPLVVPEWFDKWLDAFCRQGDGYSWRDLAAGRILQQGWGKSINDSYEVFESHWAIPHVENKQAEYVLNHKKELMVAALTGNYTVEKEKKYNVKVRHAVDSYFKKIDANYCIAGYRATVDLDEDLAQFTEAEIEHYGLQYCEKEEVTDDEV